MTPFAVAAYHYGLLPVGARRVDAVLRITPARLGGDGAEASLRIWTPVDAYVAALREVSPQTADLLDCGVRADERTAVYAARRWRSGTREYELAVAVPAGGDGDELLAARVAVLADGEVAGTATIAITFGAVTEPPGPQAATGELSELPTGASRRPRHSGSAAAHAGEPCPGCGEQTSVDDRFCEGCGSALEAD